MILTYSNWKNINESIEDDEESQVKLVDDPETDIQTLEQLATSNYFIVRYRLCRHPKVTLELIEQLLNDRSEYIRDYAARSPKLSTQRIDELIKSEDESIRKGCVYNPNTTPEQLLILADDPDEMVRKITSLAYDLPIERVYQYLEDRNESPEVKRTARQAIEIRGGDPNHYHSVINDLLGDI